MKSVQDALIGWPQFPFSQQKAVCQLPKQQHSNHWNWTGLMPAAEQRPHTAQYSRSCLQSLASMVKVTCWNRCCNRTKSGNKRLAINQL